MKIKSSIAKKLAVSPMKAMVGTGVAPILMTASAFDLRRFRKYFGGMLGFTECTGC